MLLYSYLIIKKYIYTQYKIQKKKTMQVKNLNKNTQRTPYLLLFYLRYYMFTWIPTTKAKAPLMFLSFISFFLP